MHAVSALGGILVPCNWHLSAEEVGYVLDNVRGWAVIVPPSPRTPLVHPAQLTNAFKRLGPCHPLAGQSESSVVFVDTEFTDIVRQVRPGATKVKLWATLYETPSADRGDLMSIQQLIDEGANEWPQEANFGTMFYTGGTTGTS